MEKEGCKVVEAANGEQGLDVYKRLKPHLVILDALMPVMDGFTCCKHLHKLSDKTSPDSEHLEAQGLQGVSKTPVLMMTNLDDPESVVSEYVTLSLGVASLYPEPDTPPATLVAEAEMALYQAKASGRNRYVAKV